MTTAAERRIHREEKTVEIMIAMFCHARHGGPELCGEPAELCGECAELHAYALERIARCPFGWRKPTCAHCPVHCYQPLMRSRIREVMRYAGPRMLLKYPVLAILHLVDGWRDAPVKTPRA